MMRLCGVGTEKKVKYIQFQAYLIRTVCLLGFSTRRKHPEKMVSIAQSWEFGPRGGKAAVHN
jgi:hypothetical protein